MAIIYFRREGVYMVTWNPWHGCKKISPGCQNCYVYRIDEKHGKDSSIICKTTNFNLPIKKNRQKEYKLPSGETIYTCLSSDFFLEEADNWRKEAWNIIRNRQDLNFYIITKRIHRFSVNLPEDWNDGYKNVTICCTVENQEFADFRLPIFLNIPIQHKHIICEPLLEKINIIQYLRNDIEMVIVGGESGEFARMCKYEWVLDIRRQCIQKNTSFKFKQTGANFEKDSKIYSIPRKLQHSQATKANIDYIF